MDVRGRKQRSFEEVFRDECRGVVRAAFLVLGDWELAKEVAQDSFVELFSRWRKIEEYDDPGAWLRRIAIRRAVRVRGRERHAMSLTETEVRSVNIPDGRLDVIAAMAILPVQQRAAVVLHYLEDLSVKDVAALLGCSESTVKVHLHRARNTLRVSDLAEFAEGEQ